MTTSDSPPIDSRTTRDEFHEELSRLIREASRDTDVVGGWNVVVDDRTELTVEITRVVRSD